jgi:hypothetical protein
MHARTQKLANETRTHGMVVERSRLAPEALRGAVMGVDDRTLAVKARLDVRKRHQLASAQRREHQSKQHPQHLVTNL